MPHVHSNGLNKSKQRTIVIPKISTQAIVGQIWAHSLNILFMFLNVSYFSLIKIKINVCVPGFVHDMLKRAGNASRKRCSGSRETLPILFGEGKPNAEPPIILKLIGAVYTFQISFVMACFLEFGHKSITILLCLEINFGH